ncbi:RNA polymerase sigma factor [Streptomyces sp. GQFP]|uniref:RNA polymerase sigma factor n=1 Tax=Streptomyces sp. GQFP TaxID=2907545 RepID=UPI001F286D3B|nr:sigma factor-like helix-turn-helix DNA-binding protein [Streptomyces sp. GQFP]UIX31268.1 sigma-70 family RNA polymerase sigma factor [Streptomyces sp. GQFP]
MTSPPPEPAGHTIRQPGARTPASFWDFHARYDQPYYEYSRIHLGNDKAARRLVNGVFLYLAVIWPRLERGNRGPYAWALLKQRVAGELAVLGRSPATTTETLAFARAIRAAAAPLLDSFRATFRAEYDREVTELEEGLGLYSRMARLSERQFDVLVLRDALGFDTRRTALIMGISEATVRSTRRTAKQRLATAMGYHLDEHTDDKE